MNKKTDIDTDYFKKKLEAELKTLESELEGISHKNAGNSKDWEPVSSDVNIEASDLADTADNIENYELNTALVKPLERQYNDVKLALEKIGKGAYGICEVAGEPIEKARLEANPSARTCLKHKDSPVA